MRPDMRYWHDGRSREGPPHPYPPYYREPPYGPDRYGPPGHDPYGPPGHDPYGPPGPDPYGPPGPYAREGPPKPVIIDYGHPKQPYVVDYGHPKKPYVVEYGHPSSSSTVVEDELMKKQRELEELDALIARRKALIGVDDGDEKPKAPPPPREPREPKERRGWGSEPLASDEEETLDWLPQNARRQQPAKPIKSILKKTKDPIPVASSPPQVRTQQFNN